jgi:hypothetical protein
MNGRVRRSRLFALALLASPLALASRPASAQATGTLTHNGTVMPVKGVVAVLDAKKPTVKFHVLPFVPTPAEIALLQKNDTMWLLEKPGSDPRRWPAAPHGSFRLSWPMDPKAAGTFAKAWTDVYAFGVGRPNSNLNFSLTEGELKGTLTGALKEGATVTLTSTGEGNMENEKLTWDVSLTTKLVPSLAP